MNYPNRDITAWRYALRIHLRYSRSQTIFIKYFRAFYCINLNIQRKYEYPSSVIARKWIILPEIKSHIYKCQDNLEAVWAWSLFMLTSNWNLFFVTLIVCWERLKLSNASIFKLLFNISKFIPSSFAQDLPLPN